MSLTNIGTLITSVPAHFQDSVSNAEKEDVYKFTIADGAPLNLNIVVHDLSGKPINTPTVQLFKDSDGDGKFDRSIDSSENFDSSELDRTINQQVSAETYFAVVAKSNYYHYSYSETYGIDLSTTARPAPGNTIGSNLTGVENQLTFDGIKNNPSGRIDNSNTSDMYALHMGSNEIVTLKLDGLTADADLRVINDKNNNHIVEAGEVVASSIHSGNTSESITLSTIGVLPGDNQSVGAFPGDYFVEVSQFSGVTNYNLHAVATFIPS